MKVYCPAGFLSRLGSDSLRSLLPLLWNLVGGAWVRGSPGSGQGDLGQGQVSLLGPFLFQRVPRLPGPYSLGDGRAHTAHRVGATSGPRPGRGLSRLRRRPAVGAWDQNFQNCPRERFPKPNLVWPSGAAVQSTLLKGERRLRQRVVGSLWGPRDKEGERGVREGRRCRQPRRLHRPRGELGRVHVFAPRAGTASVSRRPQRLAGAAAPSTCFSLRRSRASARPRGQKRGRSLACSASARATLNERRGRSLVADGSGRGSRQKFVAQLRLRGTCWRRPRVASPGTGGPGPRRTAQRALAAQGSSRRGSQEPRPRSRGRAVPAPSPPPRHSLRATRAALLEMSPALRALQGRHPGMPPAPRPPHGSVSRATRSPAGGAGAPAGWDARAIVPDLRRCRL